MTTTANQNKETREPIWCLTLPINTSSNSSVYKYLIKLGKWKELEKITVCYQEAIEEYYAMIEAGINPGYKFKSPSTLLGAYTFYTCIEKLNGRDPEMSYADFKKYYNDNAITFSFSFNMDNLLEDKHKSSKINNAKEESNDDNIIDAEFVEVDNAADDKVKKDKSANQKQPIKSDNKKSEKNQEKKSDDKKSEKIPEKKGDKSEKNQEKKSDKEQKNATPTPTVMMEMGVQGAYCMVDEDRINNFVNTNKKIIDQFPEIALYVDAIMKSGLKTRLVFENGLITSYLYIPGIEQSTGHYIIDPCKLRPYCSLILPNPQNATYDDLPICDYIPLSSIDTIVRCICKSITVQDIQAITTTCTYGKYTYAHLDWRGLPEGYVIPDWMESFFKSLHGKGMMARFKVVKCNDKKLIISCKDKVNLMKFFKDNKNFAAIDRIAINSDGNVKATGGVEAENFNKCMGGK